LKKKKTSRQNVSTGEKRLLAVAGGLFFFYGRVNNDGTVDNITGVAVALFMKNKQKGK